ELAAEMLLGQPLETAQRLHDGIREFPRVAHSDGTAGEEAAEGERVEVLASEAEFLARQCGPGAVEEGLIVLPLDDEEPAVSAERALGALAPDAEHGLGLLVNARGLFDDPRLPGDGDPLRELRVR